MSLKLDSKSREIARARHTNIDGIIKLGGYEAEIDYEISAVTDGESISREPASRSASMTSSQNLSGLSSEFKPVIPSLKSAPDARDPLLDVTNNKIQKQQPVFKQNYQNSGIDIDSKLDLVLRPHQKEAVAFLHECVTGQRSYQGKGALLADEMGLGKTLSTIALIWKLVRRNSDGVQVCNKVLIVCPVTLIANWNREFKKWIDINRLGVLSINGKQGAAADKQDIKNFGKNRVYNVLIMGYEKVLTCASELSEIKFDLLVCDEGHRLKSSTNKVLKVLKHLDVEKKIVLTGTPIQNDLVEFFTIVDFINPGILGLFSSFQKDYIRHILRSRDVNCTNKEIIDRGDLLSSKLIALTNEFTLRRTSDILSSFLTTKTDVILFCKPTTLQLSLFEDIKRSKTFKASYSGSQGGILGLITLFKKICNSPSLLAPEGKVEESELLGLDFGLNVELNNKTSGKLLVLIPLLLEIQRLGEKVVLVSNYTQTLKLLEQSVNKLNMKSLRLDGTTANKERDKLVNQFNKLSAESTMIFLLSAKAGGVGLNLVGASRLILFDNDWNPSVDLQAMARIHRDGQKRPVFIYRLLTTGCIDEKIFQRQLMKNNLSDKFLDNKVDSKTDVFDSDDLKDLFSVSETSSSTHDLLECDCGGDGELVEVPLEDLSENSVEDLTSSQLGYISALDFKQEDKRPKARKDNMRRALQDYRHFDVKEGHFCEDEAVNEIVNNMKKKGIPSPITFVMTKTSGMKEVEA